MSFPKSFRTVEVMQQIRYGFTPAYVEQLCTTWPSVKDYAYIVHDKDTQEDGTPTEPHIHLLLRFTGSVPTTAILAKLKGVCEVQHLEKLKSWNGAVAYLTHANRLDKYQYPDTDVYSNFDWQADKRAALAKFDLDGFIRLIDSGAVREYNIRKYIDPVHHVKYQVQIDRAFKNRINGLIAEQKQRSDNMQVYWFWGDAGAGKTSYATFMMEKVFKLPYYVSSSGSDPLGEYKGQPGVVLDDVRVEQFDASTLLKFLDPYTKAATKSRYVNKWLEADVVIITCPHSPEQWWDEYRKQNTRAGDWEQLTRRLNCGSWRFTHSAVSLTLYDKEGHAVGTMTYEPHEILPSEYWEMRNGSADNTGVDAFDRIIKAAGCKVTATAANGMQIKADVKIDLSTFAPTTADIPEEWK